MKKPIDLIREVDGIRDALSLSHSALAGMAGTQTKILEAALDIEDIRLQNILKLAHAMGRELVLMPMENAPEIPKAPEDREKDRQDHAYTIARNGEWIKFDDLELFLRELAGEKCKSSKWVARKTGINEPTAQRLLGGLGVSTKTLSQVSDGMRVEYQIRFRDR